MNLEVINVSAEVIGAGAVVITLGYLAIQIRQANAIARVGAYRDLHQDLGSIFMDMVKDPELHRMWRVGMFSEDTLSDEEQDRLGMLLSQVFSGLNIAYQSSWLDPGLNDFVTNYTDVLVGRTHIQGWWGRNRGLVAGPYRSFVDARLDKVVRNSEQRP